MREFSVGHLEAIKRSPMLVNVYFREKFRQRITGPVRSPPSSSILCPISPALIFSSGSLLDDRSQFLKWMSRIGGNSKLIEDYLLNSLEVICVIESWLAWQVMTVANVMARDAVGTVAAQEVFRSKTSEELMAN